MKTEEEKEEEEKKGKHESYGWEPSQLCGALPDAHFATALPCLIFFFFLDEKEEEKAKEEKAEPKG